MSTARTLVPRHRLLPASGPLLVSTDLHGNAEDFARLHAVFQGLGPRAHWVLLGDLVHGPSESARRSDPERCGYEDASPELVDRVFELRESWPERVHVVLGNHDHGHVGGAHTGKFHDDEVAALEARFTAAQHERAQTLFQSALLALAAPCGLVLSHGAPSEVLTRLDELDAIALDGAGNTQRQSQLLGCLLHAYGQRDETARAMLAGLSVSTGLALGVAVHGHDVDEAGFYREGDHQLCPVLFGAPDANKRYLVVDLAGRYADAHALREDVELRRLYP